jgi:hypothetical protein
MKIKTQIIVAALVFFLFLNLGFTAWPEMTLWPYLMLKGWLPYRDIAIAHNPLLLIALTFFYKLFGLGLIQLKVFTWGLILVTFSLTFWVAKRLWSAKIAAISVLFMVFFAVYYDANGLWFDLALTPFYLVTFYLVKRKRYKLAGVFWMLSFLVKQTAVFLIVPIIFELFSKKITQRMEAFLLGAFVVFLPFLAIVWIFGLLPDYVYWTFQFAGSRLPFSQGQVLFPSARQLVLGWWPYVISLTFLFVKKRKKYLNLVLWAFFAGLGVYSRWELFHILPSTPFFAYIFSSLFFGSLRMEKHQKYVIWLGIIVFLLLSVKKSVTLWHRQTRFFEPEVVEAAEFIKQNTASDEAIFVLNFWDHIYALSGTLPAIKPWIPQFSWYMDYPGIQEKMLSELILSSPEYVVYHPYSEAGLDSYRLNLIADYIERYYQPVIYYSNFEILEKR